MGVFIIIVVIIIIIILISLYYYCKWPISVFFLAFSAFVNFLEGKGSNALISP